MVMKETVKVAIEKSYLTTFGYKLDKAYYKIQEVVPISGNTHQANVWVFKDKSARTEDPNTPYQKNRMKFEVDSSTFESGISDNENKIKQAYTKLKTLTESFVNDSTDV